MKPGVLALADDATGALEVGAHFAAAGLECVVAFDPAQPIETSALVIDTETRHSDARTAADLHRALAARAREVPFLFKKTDSTLRGNVAAELTALAAALPDRPLVYAPAYPRLGRTVVAGRLYVDGVPVERTAFANDPREPVRGSCVWELFAAGTVDCAATLPSTLPPGRIVICDGTSDEDLDRVAAGLAGDGRPHIAAGPGGFAASWVRHIDVARREPVRPTAKAERCLVVCGSLHPASREQVRGAGLPSSGWSVLEPAGCEPGCVVAALDRLDALVVFGGDTLFSILAAAGVKTVTPIGELLPGVPYSRFRFRGRELGLFTKAGGFGPPDTLIEIRRKVSP